MKIKSLLLAIFLVNATITGLNATKPAVLAGDWYYKQFNFKKALPFYLKVLKKEPSNAYLQQRVADSYRLIGDWADAEKYYKDLVSSSGNSPVDKLYYAQALRANQKYAEAKEAYKAYADANPDDAAAKEIYKEFNEVAELSQDKGYYSVKNFEKINSSSSDFGVSFYGDKGIFFCSNRRPDAFIIHKDQWTRGNFLKIYTALQKDSLSDPSNPEILNKHALNKKFHQGVSSFNAKMQELYLDRSNYNGRKAFTSADKTVKLKLFKMSWLTDQNKWGDAVAEAVPFNDKEYSVAHPSLSKDGKTLFFASDKPGGIGGVDIYMSTREIGGTWSVPQNLGKEINTIGDEMFPFIADDGTLYFASSGHTGLGGLDIYSSRPVYSAGKLTGWTKPENLGAPINTNADDFGFIIDAYNKRGYLCSNRQGGKGDDDIYSFTRNDVMLNGLVYDASTNLSLDSAIVVIKNENLALGTFQTAKEGSFTTKVLPDKTYSFTATRTGYSQADTSILIKSNPTFVKIPMEPTGDIKLDVTILDKKTRALLEAANVKLINLNTNVELNCSTSKDGKCFFKLDPETRYLVEGSKETGLENVRYLKVTSAQNTRGMKGPKTIYLILELEKVEKNVAIRLENIYYDFDKWNIRPDAAKELDKLVKTLKDNPGIEIELSSHTDCRGSVNYNQVLSGKRAQSAVDYIISQGIDKKRITAAGYGKSRLIIKCSCDKTGVPCTEEEHQVNRRTEFKILKF
jgi:outer membrane protein OmpA-like peptidoglycan-associated protein